MQSIRSQHLLLPPSSASEHTHHLVPRLRFAATTACRSVLSPCTRAAPPGLTSSNGTACNTATCSSPFVAPDARTPKPTADKQCSSCDAGFGGINCNVCQSPSACQARKSSLGLGSSSSLFGTNDTLVCHKQPSAVRTTYIDCNVNQTTVNGVYPGEMRMTLSKTYQTDDFAHTGLATWPEQQNTALSQVWLDGVEQFYCQAAGCTARNSTETLDPQARFGSSLWTCSSLQCYCIPGTTMCGKGQLDLSPVINQLNGTLTMPCDYLDPTNPTAVSHCAFRGELLNNFLGSQGLPLDQCQFGSCITQAELDTFWATGSGESSSNGSRSGLSNAVIAGLVILGVAVAAIAALLLIGLWQQRKARRLPKGAIAEPLGLQWYNNLTYAVPDTSVGLRRRKPTPSAEQLAETVPSTPFHASSASGGDLTVLRNSSGRIEPGCMVAVLGPSGAGKTSLVEILAGRHKIGRVSGAIQHSNPSPPRHSRRGHRDAPSALSIRRTHCLPSRRCARLCRWLPTSRCRTMCCLPRRARSSARPLHSLGWSAWPDKRIGDSTRRGLSGGERRRVSIGCALVSRPRLLVADEPLSGLDAFSASRVVAAFRELAHGAGAGSTTVVVTVHQPSSEIYYSFDQVMLMSHGAVLYHGSPADSLEWCQKMGESCRLDTMWLITCSGSPRRLTRAPRHHCTRKSSSLSDGATAMPTRARSRQARHGRRRWAASRLRAS